MTDIFPAIIALYPTALVSTWESPYLSIGISDSPKKIFNDSRVIVHKNHLIVGSDGPRGPQTIFSAQVQEVFKDGTFIRVLTTDNELAVIAKSKGCGCGSRLRSWNAYGNTVSA